VRRRAGRRQRCFQTRLVFLPVWPRSFAWEASRIAPVTILG